MIEDLQDELPQEQPKEKEKKTLRRGTVLFLAFIVWILYSAVIVLSSLPKIITAVRESNIVELASNYSQLKDTAQTRDEKLCFVIPRSDGGTVFVTSTQRVKRTGASEYHDVMEGLLSGPGDEALAMGAISFIAPDTTLIGLTVSGSVAFVNLSESFTSSGSTWGPNGLETACRQVTRTLQAMDSSIRDVVILINGEELKV